MKKTLLSSLFTLMACLCMGQVTYLHPELYFDKMSPNGKYLSAQTLGYVYLYSRPDSVYDEYYASEDAVTEYYATGIGNCWSNDGILVGSVNDRECAYWKDFEWNELPIKSENQGLNMANCITPDGSRIAGFVGIAAMDMTSQMIKPVYWDRTADGDYELYKELPYPTTDFCGRTPQYVTAIAISDDGKTIVGQIVDWSGFYTYPIVYTQGNDGEWSYRTICEGVLYSEGATFGTWPGEEPIKPDGEEYMNDEELAAYRADMAVYLDAYEQYTYGEIPWDDVPTEPDPADYIVDRLDEYLDAINKYQQDLQNYYNALNEFDMIMMDNMLDCSFTFNNVYISGNGRYYATTIKRADLSDPLNPKAVNTPVYFDLHNGDQMVMLDTNRDMIASTIMNDGRMIAQNPAMAYGRNSFVVSTDGKEFTTFVDYITERNSDVGDWVKSLTTFDVQYAESYDEYGNPTIAIAEDSIVSGSVHCNSDGSVFTSFMYDEWSDGDVMRQFSYQIDFNEGAGVEGITTDRNNVNVYVADRVLYISENVDKVTLYNMQGTVVKVIAGSERVVALDVVPGVYLARITADANNQVTKVMVK